MMKEILSNSPAAIEIKPLDHSVHATVRLPGSKSLTNRVLLIAALANGTTTLTNALFSDDSGYFAGALQKLGIEVSSDESQSRYVVHGLSGLIPAEQADLFVGNAGTAARFLTAMLTLGHGDFRIDGDARMRQRPIQDLIDTLTQLGVSIHSKTGCLPAQVKATGLSGGVATISGETSSQFLSGLLMAAPYAQTSMDLKVAGGLNSRPYIDMTLAVMADFGVPVTRKGYEQFWIEPGKYHSPGTYPIESDASAASYFFAVPAILGGTVRVENISRQSRQGDIAFLDVLQKMGCKVQTGPTTIEVSGPSELLGVDVDMRDISDTAQTLAVVAPFANFPTTIRGIGFIRAKETDRIGAVCAELNRLGVQVEENPDGMTIHPAKAIRPALIRTYRDHRMAMAFSLIGLRVAGISIEDPACVSKTFPNFFDVLEKLR